MKKLKNEELIIKVIGSYPLKFQWGWISGDERIGGLGIIVGELCPPDTLESNFKFVGGGVINRKDAKKLMKFIQEGLSL